MHRLRSLPLWMKPRLVPLIFLVLCLVTEGPSTAPSLKIARAAEPATAPVKSDPLDHDHFAKDNGNPGDSENKKEAELERTSVLNAAKDLENRIPKFPGSERVKSLIRDYRLLLKPEAYGDSREIGSHNSGIKRFTEKLSEDRPKLAVQALAFYEEVQKIDSKHVLRPDKSSENPLGNRAALSQSAGDSPFYEDLKPGWLWRLALKYAQYDFNDAVRLIGICGHDDASQGSPTMKLPPQEQRKRYRAKLAELNQRIVLLEKSFSEAKNDGVLTRIENEINALKNMRKKYSYRKFCIRSSLLS